MESVNELVTNVLSSEENKNCNVEIVIIKIDKEVKEVVAIDRKGAEVVAMERKDADLVSALQMLALKNDENYEKKIGLNS